MKKLTKITNVALVFTLIALAVCEEKLVYSSSVPQLRVPVGGRNHKDILKTILVHLSTDQLIQEAEMAMPFCEDVDQNWAKFNIIIQELRKRQDIKISILAGDKFKHNDKINTDDNVKTWMEDMDKYQKGFLNHTIPNVLRQHVKEGIALVVMQEITTKKGAEYTEISVIDNGTGPIDIYGKRPLIRKILEYGTSVGKDAAWSGGRGSGIGLPLAVRGCPDLATIHVPGNSAVIRTEKTKKKLPKRLPRRNIIWQGENKKSYGMTVTGYFYEQRSPDEDIERNAVSKVFEYAGYRNSPNMNQPLACEEGLIREACKGFRFKTYVITDHLFSLLAPEPTTQGIAMSRERLKLFRETKERTNGEYEETVSRLENASASNLPGASRLSKLFKAEGAVFLRQSDITNPTWRKTERNVDFWPKTEDEAIMSLLWHERMHLALDKLDLQSYTRDPIIYAITGRIRDETRVKKFIASIFRNKLAEEILKIWKETRPSKKEVSELRSVARGEPLLRKQMRFGRITHRLKKILNFI